MTSNIQWSRILLLAVCTLVVATALLLVTHSTMPVGGYVGAMALAGWFNRRSQASAGRVIWAALGVGAIMLLAWWGYEKLRF